MVQALNRLVLVVALALAGCAPGDLDDSGATCSALLLPGDLVITEVFANAAGDDTGREWFEIYNASGGELSLRGLELTTSKDDGSSARTHAVARALTLADADYLVLGDTLDELTPAHVDYGYGAELGRLRNESGRIALGCGDTSIDEARYDQAPDNASLGLDGSIAPDSGANDVLANWCEATQAYAGDALGSPGAANESCGAVPTGRCLDGDTEREITPPAPGELVITEVLANPPGSGTDDAQEWFEVLALADIDLNGLALADASNQDLIDSAECLSISAGSYVVFARNASASANGGLPAVATTFDFALNNGAETVRLSYDGVTIDEATLSRAPDGVAQQLDAGSLTAAANDDEANWCDATEAYGATGALGTPGAANAPCSLEGTCLDGGVPRPIVSPAVGELVITEVFPDPIGTDTDQEWFELVALADVDLNGLTFGDGSASGRSTIDGVDCVRIPAGGYALLARSDDPASNGELPAVNAVFDFALNNTGTETVFVALGAATIDAMTYTGSSEGVSIQLDPDLATAAANDDQANWCDGATPFNTTGGLGTPGEENDQQCPAP